MQYLNFCAETDIVAFANALKLQRDVLLTVMRDVVRDVMCYVVGVSHVLPPQGRA